MPEVYEIARQWSEGFTTALLPGPRDENQSEHWLAGWDVGYALRPTKHELLNLYMVQSGHKPFAKVRAI